MTPADTVRTLSPGTRLGRYRVAHRIGMGGMAELYLAVLDGPAELQKLVVLKLVHAHLSGDEEVARMLAKEARIASTLDHPNIASVIDFGREGGEQYLVMEYVHGRDVHAILKAHEGRPLALPFALEIVRCACQALFYAHTKRDLQGRPMQIVHRDVSPSNVLVGYGGSVALVDFGIAKIGAHLSTTQTGILKGKFGYMSPEQSLGMELDARSDIFALGILLYELTTGRRAYSGPNSIAIMNDSIAAAYVPPEEVVEGYPPQLSAIVRKAMQPAPEDRYATAAQMQADVEAFALSQQLVLGEPAARAQMERLFGAPEPPAVSLPPEVEPEVDRDSLVFTQPGRRWRRRGVLGLFVGTAAFVGWWVGTSRAGSPDPPETPAPKAPAATAPSEPPAADPIVEPIEPDAGVVAPVVQPAPAPPEQPKKKPRRRRRKKPKRAKGDDLEGMLPPSMR